MNLNTFRVFLTVYEKKSMTQAASELHLTQSGVSQHIHSLEDELGFALFERVNRKLFPTARAAELYTRGKRGIQEIEAAVGEVKQIETLPRGTVKIGMPVEFGNNVAIPKLAEFGKKYPDVNFDITMDFATVLSGMVLRGELDFALIDRFRVDPTLKLERVADEVLVLCGLKSYVKKFGPVRYTSKYFDPIVRNWFRHHLSRHNIPIRVRAHVFDVQGVAKFITSGFGLGVLPADTVARIGQDLHVFEGKHLPLKNEICLAYLPLKDRPLAQKMAQALFIGS